jgi:hypothetical protein
MTIKVRNKKEFREKIAEYRRAGWMLITFVERLAELEKDNEIVVIER